MRRLHKVAHRTVYLRVGGPVGYHSLDLEDELMLLRAPVIITSRLLPGVQVGKASISIGYSLRLGDSGRTRYHYHIDIPGPPGKTPHHTNDICYSADDLQSGCGGGNLQEGLESLLCFLSACGESVSYSPPDSLYVENSDLFPPAVGEWAAENSDELSMLECELQETENLITE